MSLTSIPVGFALKFSLPWANAGVADVTARTLARTMVNVNVATTQNTDTFEYIKSCVIIHPLLGSLRLYDYLHIFSYSDITMYRSAQMVADDLSTCFCFYDSF